MGFPRAGFWARLLSSLVTPPTSPGCLLCPHDTHGHGCPVPGQALSPSSRFPQPSEPHPLHAFQAPHTHQVPFWPQSLYSKPASPGSLSQRGPATPVPRPELWTSPAPTPACQP